MTDGRPRVVVTRGVGAGSDLPAQLEAAGFDVAWVPLIETVPLVTPGVVAAAVRGAAGGWVVVTSAVAARMVADAVGQTDTGVSYAAVGEATAAVLRARGRAGEVLVAEQPAGAEALLDALRNRVRQRRVLVLAAEAGRRELAGALRAAGADLTELVAYRTAMPPVAAAAFLAALDPLPDALVFASGSAARHAAAVADPAHHRVPVVLCIGHATAMEAGRAGWTNLEVAAETSDEGIVASLHARLLSG